MLVINLPRVSVRFNSDNKRTSSQIDVLDLTNMDIYDVLKLISKKSGLNIIAGNNVQGRVNRFIYVILMY